MSSRDGDPAVDEGESRNVERRAAPSRPRAATTGSLDTDLVRAGGTPYRRAAQGLGAVGLLAAAAGVAVPDAREVLFALAVTGFFGSVLAYASSSERFVPLAVAEGVYDATATNEAAIVDALAGSTERVYAPTGDRSQVVLYVPPEADHEIPDGIAAPWTAGDARPGIALVPTGAELYRRFQRRLTGDLEGSVTALAVALAEGLVEVLGLARAAHAEVDPHGGRATVTVRESAYGDVDRFDHPIASFLAVGFARELDRPVRLEVRSDGSDWLVTCSWDPDGS